jgi:hypothetical protein
LACLFSDLILSVRTQKLGNGVDCMARTEFTVFSVIIELSHLPVFKFALMLSLISKLMVTCLDSKMVNTPNVRNGAENSQGNGNRLHRHVWLKRSPRSLSPAMSRPSCCGSSLQTPPGVAMGQEILQLQLRPPIATSQLCTRRSSPRQESLLRLTTGFG